jgi:hypothetical protein
MYKRFALIAAAAIFGITSAAQAHTLRIECKKQPVRVLCVGH